MTPEELHIRLQEERSQLCIATKAPTTTEAGQSSKP